jgi:hypothetical protein
MEDHTLLPDMTAIQDREIELPTLNMEPNPMSLSGLINTIDIGQFNAALDSDQHNQHILLPNGARGVTIPTSGTTYQVPAGTVNGQHEAITINLVPTPNRAMKTDGGFKTDVGFPTSDITDSIRGFQRDYSNENQNWTNPTTNTSTIEGSDFVISQMEQIPQRLKPKVVIVEQPKQNALRFRYECEGRSAGALQGASSTADHKTFPKIKVENYQGAAVVVVSCVTENGPYKAHPHNLVSPRTVGRDGCKKGVCTMNINNETMTVEFQNLGVQCVRRKDIQKSLTVRKEIRVDPFRQAFKHIENPQSIDLNAVRLCFQVFLEGKTQGKYTEILDPVVSQPVYDAKAKRELQIMDISDTTSSVQGGKKIIILCEKVSKEDIKVRFVDDEGWEAQGEFTSNDVHKQYAISLKTPPYKDLHITEERKVYIELYKPSNLERGDVDRHEFSYLPAENLRRNSPGSSRDKQTADVEYKKNNMWNGGAVFTEDNKSHIRIKRESNEIDNNGMTEWQRMTGSVQQQQPTHGQNRTGYSHVALVGDGFSMKPNPSQFLNQVPPMMGNYNLVTAQNIPNIPVSQNNLDRASPNIGQHSPGNINYQAQSPDSHQFRQLNIEASPQGMNMGSPQGINRGSPSPPQNYVSPYINSGEVVEIEQLVDNLSGKIETTHLTQPEHRPKGKRGAREADLTSGSNVVPRQAPSLDRQQSSIHTPDVSTNISDIVNSTLARNMTNDF